MIQNVSPQQSLATDFYDGLKRYHNVDGQGNGGHVDGVQLPPGVKPDELDASMHGVSDFLSKQEGMTYVEAPASGPARTAFRKALAESRRAEVSGHVKENLAAAVSLIQSPAIRQAVQQALDAAPPEFMTAPSSSSGRYHPADEINPGGLVLHSLRDVQVGAMLCDYYHVGGKAKDEILGGLLLHDIKKGGEPWKGYAADHGPLASQWLGKVWAHQSDPSLTTMRELVANHMAQWNEPAPTPPKDVANQIASYADYLGSRDNLYVQTPLEAQNGVVVKPPKTEG